MTYLSKTAVLSFATVLFLATAVCGQTVFQVVDDSFSIQSALDSASSGDTILVGPGTYSENLDFNGRLISLRSVDGPGSTFINVNGGSAVSISGAAEISGFTISGGIASSGAGVNVSGAGTLIQGNIFDGNRQTAGGFGAAIGGNVASPTISGNIFRNNTSDSQFLSGVVSFINGSSPLIENNIFENNDSRGINLTLPASTNPRVINNTFFNNTVGIRVDRRIDSSNYEILNNIFAFNDTGVEVDFGSDANNPTFENNLVFGNSTDFDTISDLTGIDGNLSASPLFIDAANGDFRLTAGSAAIDAGGATDAPLIDFFGNARPFDGDGINGPQFDIGAIEFSATVPEPANFLIVLSALLFGSTRRTRSSAV